jgi:putative PIN family toxin of toxin-antitoxin system
VKVVIDTNVLVSGLLNPHGIPAEILGMFFEEKIIPCYDVRILFEYTEVLNRPKFNFSKPEINALLDFIKYKGSLILARKYPHKLRDPGDLPFLEVALGSQAAFLITGNLAHFPKGIGQTKVVSPAQFVKNRYKPDHY